jgi:uncharacterized membrane protein YfcA
LLVGVSIGAKSFRNVGEDTFRRWVLRLLMALALLSAVKSIVSLV